jgi:glyoxylase-like metal-dependent hydrolase (beta-lactamase superfamily II)
MFRNILSLSFLSFLLAYPLSISAKDDLKLCWQKQVASLNTQFLTLTFDEKINRFEHSFEPWQQTLRVAKGTVWTNTNSFMKFDTMTNTVSKRTYISKTQLNEKNVLFLDYGDKDLFEVTKSMFYEKIIETARYSGVTLVDYFYKQKIKPAKESTKTLAIYQTTIHQTIVKLFIRKSDNLLEKITALSDDELFGDALSSFVYKDYANEKDVFYAKSIAIEKINGKLKDEVVVSKASLSNAVTKLLDEPAGYSLKEDETFKPDIKTEKYSPNIHFLELKHTDDRVMIVEFKDFLLVAESPLTSKNGELIINEAKKIAPNKPIKYFVFGHYHAHYLGGVRPFVHKGVTVICSKEDQPYVSYLATNPHTLQPDSLQMQPKSLLTTEIIDSMTISDGSFEMKIYTIGDKSQHTKDYLVYYFPSEKLLFEDDLVWIAKEGDIRKASGRQTGLYNALKDLNLDITTIIQSWPINEMRVKTVIPFADLEKSMSIK